MEWQTLALGAVIYAAWTALTWLHAALPWWARAACGGWVCAWHASFQHELIHGHPTRNAAVNHALGSLPLLLWLPFARYRALHLAHHRDEQLTDPLEDPETRYFTPAGWRGLGRLGRALLRAQACLAGRLVIGPFWTIGRFLWLEATAARDARNAWRGHAIGVAVVLAWLAVCRLNPLIYGACFVLPGTSLMLLRAFAEHRAAPDPRHRTAIVEGAPILGLLFLYNNLHVVHHARPSLPWYALPGAYRRGRAMYLSSNNHLLYAGYLDVARRFLWRAHDLPVLNTPANSSETAQTRTHA